MAAPTVNETPFQLNSSLYDPPGTVRRETCLAMEPGQTPIDDAINIWLCEVHHPFGGNALVVRRWRCIHSTHDGMVGQLLALGGAAGFEVIGAAPGMPAMNLWVQHTFRHAGQRPEAQRDDVIPAEIMQEIRQLVRAGQSVRATKLVYHNSTRDLRTSRDYVRQLAAEAERDTAILAAADVPLEES